MQNAAYEEVESRKRANDILLKNRLLQQTDGFFKIEAQDVLRHKFCSNFCSNVHQDTT